MEMVPSTPQPGDRVAALSFIEGDIAYLFGYGIFKGYFPVDEEACGLRSAVLRETQQPDPQVVLDDGTIVWGSECWILRANEQIDLFEGRSVQKVEFISITKTRAKAPKFLVVRFYHPPNRELEYVPVRVDDDIYQRMKALRSLGRNLHLEGEFLRRPAVYTVTITSDEGDEEVEFVYSREEEYTLAVSRVVERAYTRELADDPTLS